MNEVQDVSLVYITDLDHKNYKIHKDVMRENLKRIIRASSLDLGNLAILVGVTRLTIKRFVVDENDAISFVTANKINNLVFQENSK